MKTENNAKSKAVSTQESIVVPLHIIALTITFLGPLVVLGYQVLHWAKQGQWLPLPISVTGFESWQGLASLPLSLGIFCIGLLLSKIIESFYPEEDK